MDKIRVSLDPTRYRAKPNKYETISLADRIARNIKSYDKDSIKAFAKLVGGEGCTFCPSTFKAGKDDFTETRKRRESFDRLQLPTLDFDNDEPDKIISFEEVKARADHYDLRILFAYDTFRSRPEHSKFRVVFLNDNPITDIRAAETMLRALTTIFPEADRQCKSAVQMYYGGKRLRYFDDTVPTINIESVIRNTTNYLEDRYGANHYKRKVVEFSRETGIALNEKGLLDVSIEEESAESIGANVVRKNLPKSSIYVEIGRKLPKNYYRINYGENCTGSLSAEKRSDYHRSYRSDVLSDIGSVCQLYREFETGERRLGHTELFGIATNLLQVESGADRFKRLLREHSYYDDRPEKYRKWVQDLRRIKGYKPYGCSGFCPYADTCPHGTNILSTVKPKQHRMERIANYVEHYVTLEEAEKDFKRIFLRAVTADIKGWHIIKAQTALGKTQSILELLVDTQLRVLVVVPTNKLKREIRKRAKRMGIELTASPSLHEIKDDLPHYVWSELETLLNSGKPTMPYIDKLISEDNPECAAVLKKYKGEQDTFKESGGHAITTHKRFLTMDTGGYDLVIVDEDIIFNTVIPNKADISIDDLKRLKKELSPASPLARKINRILKYIKSDEFFTLKGTPYNEVYADITMAVDIPALCSASHFCYRKEDDCVSLLKPIRFNPNAKFIMVSATVDERVCEYYFGGKMKFYECANARNVGVLDQYYGRSLSRSDIDRDTVIFRRIKDWSGFEHTISFKKHLLAGLYDGELHFNNCAGCDYMKGENIDVIGTPHQPEWIYKLFAFSLPGLDFDINARLKPGTIVEHNGWRFRFMTYEDKALRDIQFYMIESQSEQAVGRARLLRCGCKVNLHSNFPLRQANMKASDYDNHAADDGTFVVERKEL